MPMKITGVAMTMVAGIDSFLIAAVNGKARDAGFSISCLSGDMGRRNLSGSRMLY